MLLSIGMIVKDEENYLESCLLALNPILKKTDVELVITDTGSTDNTINIAQKFTNKIYTYTWDNNFANARNFCLNKCSGKWFMYIDADEVFAKDDISEIYDFLSSPKEKEYNSASLIIKNYTDKSLTKYNEFNAIRIHRIFTETKFIGEIHERIEYKQPTFNTEVIVNHFGYISSKSANKIDRNYQLLLDSYKNDSKNPLTLLYLFNISQTEKQKEFYLSKWEELIATNLSYAMDDIYPLTAIPFYLQTKNFLKCTSLSIKLIDTLNGKNSTSILPALMFLGDSYFYQQDYASAQNSYNEYLKQYNRYKNKKLHNTSATCLEGIQEYEFETRKILYAYCLYECNNLAESTNTLENVSFERIPVCDYQDLTTYISEIVIANIKKSDYKPFKLIISRIANYNIPIANSLLSSCYFNLETRQNFYDNLPSTCKETIPGIMYEILCNNSNNHYALVQNFINNIPEYNSSLSPILLEGLQHYSNVNLSALISIISREELENSITIIKDTSCYAKIVKNFCNTYEISNIKDLYFEISLLRPIISIDDTACYTYSMLLANYVSNAYSPEMLNDSDAAILSSEELLGYYMYKADTALSSNDLTVYLKYLRLSLKPCPEMKNTISRLSEELMTRMEQNETINQFNS